MKNRNAKRLPDNSLKNEKKLVWYSGIDSLTDDGRDVHCNPTKLSC